MRTATPPSSAPVLLEHASLEDGLEADVAIASGRVLSVTPRLRDGGTYGEATPRGVPTGGTAASRHDLEGYLLLPAAAEPHTHLDKALLVGRFPNRTGDFAGAFEAMEDAYRHAMTRSDIQERVLSVLGIGLQRGYTAVRTHVNCEQGIGTRGVEVLCAVRDRVASLVDLQIAPLASKPVTGREGADNRAILKEALDAGVDLMGGFPQVDERPVDAMRLLVAMAAEAGVPVDLHLDETTDPEMFVLSEYAAEVVRNGLAGRATASHCVSLGQQDPLTIARTADQLAEAGIGVVTLPQTNLLLQGKGAETQVPRGLTAVDALRRAGVVVAGGGDNRRDPFNPLGRVDPLETAALLVAAAHLGIHDAYQAVSSDARSVMGIANAGLDLGDRADLLAIRAKDLVEAVAEGQFDRWVFREGSLVARTRVSEEVDAADLLDELVSGGVTEDTGKEAGSRREELAWTD